MNGISLLLLVSSLGATTSVENGTNGQPVYTIRIESLLINELRNGQTVPILVAPRDRRVRHFKIAITPDVGARTGGLSRASDLNSRAGDLYDYEPTQLENGEIEYVVQISPERLESLAAGKPIEGDIAQDITEVNRYLIFVGIGQLPSQQQAAALAANSPSHIGVNNGLVPAGAEVRASSDPQSRNNNITPLPKNPFLTATQPTTQRGIQGNDPLTQFNTRTNDPRANWRNQPDQSTVNPPPFANSGQSPATSSTGFPRSPSIPATNDRNAYANQPNYSTNPPTYNNQYPLPNYGDPNSGYAQTNPALYPPQGYAQQPGYAANPANGYQQPAATVAARNDLPPASSNTAQPNSGWSQPTANNTQAAVTQPAAAAQPAVSTLASAKAVEVDRPWTPLILTTLALFASLGSNAYLGWLAWSFFWRFRDAVTESARTRAQHSMSRQAA